MGLLQNAVVFHIGNMFSLFLLYGGIICSIAYHFGVLTYVLIAFVAYYITVVRSKAHFTGAKESPSFRASSLQTTVLDYFSMDITLDFEKETMDPTRRYLLGIHPHGIHCWPMIMWSCTKSAWYKMFPWFDCGGLVASVLFYVPLVRELFLSLGYRDASYKSALKLLKSRSLYLNPGGEAESLETEQGTEKAVVLDRLGLIRLALEADADIIPVYSLGQMDTYTTFTAFKPIQRWLSKKFRIALPLFYGRWFSPMPYKTEMRILVGKPISTKDEDRSAWEGGKPPKEVVELYHAQYVSGLKAVVDKYKERFGYGDRELQLLASRPQKKKQQ